jgi:cell shape-determining protein MreC
MEQALERVQEKMKELIKKYQQTLKEKDRLQEENRSLRNLLKERDHMVEELQATRDAALLNSSLADNQQKKDLEKKLNLYIREIDRCITLLAE